MRKNISTKITLLFLFIIFILNIKSYASNSDFKYEVNGNIATITAYTGSNSTVTIPNSIDGYEVKKIANHAFDSSRNTTNGQILKNVTISEGIIVLGDFAFVNCTNLEKIYLPESLTTLGDETFIGCTNLKEINIPSKITSFGFSGSMFQENGFSEFTIPQNVKSIPTCTFRICKNLKKVTVYSDDVKYGENVFQYCSKDLILYGHEGSTTQTYAKENNLNFEILSDENKTVENETEVKNETIAIQSILLNKKSLSLYVGDSENLIATILPDNATDKELIWSSSDSNIVTVENGNVTAKNIGSATIRVSNSDGNITNTCNVSVTNKPANIENSNNSNNTSNQTSNLTNTQTSNQTTNTIKQTSKTVNTTNAIDNSTANRILPKTGLKYSIFGILILAFVILFILYKKYDNLKNF